MDRPPPDPLPPTPSLADRVRERLARSRPAVDLRGDRRAGVALAVLLAAGPLATLLGARLMEDRVRSEAAALRPAAAPRLAAEQRRSAGQAELAPLLIRPGVGATLEGIARALPAEAMLVRVQRGDDGRLALDAAAPDPDKLRSALRRDPVTGRLRDTGQQRGDAAIVVTFEEGA
ncbi:hypothetical protein [Sphingomonas sp. DT-204]|uniref:hypothetical protein n=1 Tax=Sphingomonas sp. DT-204 TaxID=3396166 RepID=UPI003F1DA371